MIRVEEGLYLGNQESARNLLLLEQTGITHVVNCAREVPNFHDGRFTYLAVGLLDPDPDYHEQIERVCAFIDGGRSGGRVLVHCFAAISRSPAVVLAYLCHLGVPLEEAARRLGEITWTYPDWKFLSQLARHHGKELDERELRLLSRILTGRARDEGQGDLA